MATATYTRPYSIALGIVLTFLFGPLGVLYVNVLAGIIMMAATLLSGGLLAAPCWVISILMAIFHTEEPRTLTIEED